MATAGRGPCEGDTSRLSSLYCQDLEVVEVTRQFAGRVVVLVGGEQTHPRGAKDPPDALGYFGARAQAAEGTSQAQA